MHPTHGYLALSVALVAILCQSFANSRTSSTDLSSAAHHLKQLVGPVLTADLVMCAAIVLLGPSHQASPPRSALLAIGLLILLGGGSTVSAAYFVHAQHASPETAVQLIFTAVRFVTSFGVVLLLWTGAARTWTALRAAMGCVGATILAACALLYLCTGGEATEYPPARGSLPGALVGSAAVIHTALWLSPSRRVLLHDWLGDGVFSSVSRLRADAIEQDGN